MATFPCPGPPAPARPTQRAGHQGTVFHTFPCDLSTRKHTEGPGPCWEPVGLAPTLCSSLTLGEGLVGVSSRFHPAWGVGGGPHLHCKHAHSAGAGVSIHIQQDGSPFLPTLLAPLALCPPLGLGSRVTGPGSWSAQDLVPLLGPRAERDPCSCYLSFLPQGLHSAANRPPCPRRPPTTAPPPAHPSACPWALSSSPLGATVCPARPPW